MKNRLVNYDLLRIFAAYLIIMLHLSVQYIHEPPSSFEAYQQWEYALAFSAFSRVGVPVFIMLSGLFLLNPQKQLTVYMVYTKYLPKLLLIFIFWSFFYAFSEQNFFHTFWEMTNNPSISASFSDRLALCWGRMNQDFFWESVIKGHYHMWYLYMLAGLYLITPLLRVFTEHATKSQFLYFIVLCVVITSITKFNDALWKSELFSQALDTIALTFVFGYVGYFIAGYFLDSVFGSRSIKSRKLFRLRNTGDPNRGKEFFLKAYTVTYNFLRRLDKPALLLYVLGILAYLLTFFGTKQANPMFGFKTPDLTLFSNYSPTVFLMSFAIFALAAKAKNCKFPRIVIFLANKLPQYMLTVYMIHPFIISEVRRQGFVFNDSFPLALPLQSFIIFLISLGISIVLMHIYYLGRRLVRFRSK